MQINSFNSLPLSLKEAEKFLIKKGKQGVWFNQKDATIIREIKEDEDIYNALKKEDKEFLDILFEGVEKGLDQENIFEVMIKGKFSKDNSSEVKEILLKNPERLFDEVYNEVMEKNQKEYEESKEYVEFAQKKAEWEKKVRDFCKSHNKYKNNSLRNFGIALGLLTVLAGAVATKAKLDDIAFGEEQEKIEALWEQEKKEDAKVLVKHAVENIRNAEDKQTIDIVVRKYEDVLLQKEDSFLLKEDKLFLEQTLKNMGDFEKENSEEAKNFFTNFLSDKLGNRIYGINIYELQNWLEESKYDSSEVTKIFLENLLSQLEMYRDNIDGIEKSFEEYIDQIKKAKGRKYIQLGIKEEQAPKTETQEVIKETPEEIKTHMAYPIYEVKKELLIDDIVTNMEEMKGIKKEEGELLEKLKERDQKKKAIDEKRADEENMIRSKNKEMSQNETYSYYQTLEQTDRYYKYAKALFVKTARSNVYIKYNNTSTPKKIISYEDAVIDSLSHTQAMEELNRIINKIKEEQEAKIKNDIDRIVGNANQQKSTVDNEYSTYENDLQYVQSQIDLQKRLLVREINRLEIIIDKKDIPGSKKELQERKNKLQSKYNVNVEDLQKIIKYKLDNMFFSYNFEEIEIIKNFDKEIMNISAITGLSEKDIYNIARPYIHEDVSQVGEENMKEYIKIIKTRKFKD